MGDAVPFRWPMTMPNAAMLAPDQPAPRAVEVG